MSKKLKDTYHKIGELLVRRNLAPAAAIDEALAAKQEGKKRVILFNLSGHGHFDMSSYESFLAGKLENFGFNPELQQ